MDGHLDLALLGIGLMVTAGAAAFCLKQAHALRRARQYLRLAKQEVQEILQISLSNPYPLIEISREGKILFVNPTALALFPGIREQGTAHPILHGFDRDCEYRREVLLEHTVYHQTVVPTTTQGEAAYIVYCYDISAQKRHEAELKEARIAADNANQARGDFLANMSHELRTPMNGIIGLSDMLLEEKLGDRHHQMIKAVSSSAHNLLVLLNDILDFSKIEAGELAIESIVYDPRQMASQVASLQGMAARRKGLAMIDTVANHVPSRLMGDPSRLQQVLNNLLNNAIKFTHAGSITLSIEGDNTSDECFLLRLVITDTGIGIPPDKQEKVFAKFQQADSSTARKYGGTGLGLAITKELTELMGGTVTIASTVGQGTSFTVTIPSLIAQAAEERDEQHTHSPQQLRIHTGARVLLVDDNPVNLMFLRMKLQQIGFSALTEAATGKEALDHVSRAPCDLIFMDGQMPEMDGFEASRAIRRLPGLHPRPIIIAVTADAMKGAAERCKDAGMDDYISKPIDKEALYGLLQRWLPGDGNRAASATPQEAEMNSNEPPRASEDAMDWERFYSFTDGNADMEAEIVELFMNNAGSDIQELARCHAQKEYAAWVAAAHKLFGSASLIGANAVSAPCDEAQYLSGQEVQRIEELHVEILGGYHMICALLTSRRAA